MTKVVDHRVAQSIGFVFFLDEMPRLAEKYRATAGRNQRWGGLAERRECRAVSNSTGPGGGRANGCWRAGLGRT